MTSDKNRPLIDRGTPPHWGGSDKNLPLNGKLGPPPTGGGVCDISWSQRRRGVRQVPRP